MTHDNMEAIFRFVSIHLEDATKKKSGNRHE